MTTDSCCPTTAVIQHLQSLDAWHLKILCDDLISQVKLEGPREQEQSSVGWHARGAEELSVHAQAIERTSEALDEVDFWIVAEYLDEVHPI